MLPALWLSQGLKRCLGDGTAPSSSASEGRTRFAGITSGTKDRKLLRDPPGYRKSPQPLKCSPGKRGPWPGWWCGGEESLPHL